MRKSYRKYLCFFQILLFVCTKTLAQLPDSLVSPPENLKSGIFRDSLKGSNADPNFQFPISNISLDTFPGRAASATSEVPGRDSLVVDLTKIKISKDGLDAEVDYGAKDSMWFDVTNKQLHLYGSAFVKYTSIDLKSGYILLDYGLNTVSARGIADTSGQIVGQPEFKDGDQAFTAKELKYNFKTKKGIIYEAYSKQDDLFVLGQKAKFVGSQDADTSKTRNTIYNQNALLTTCNDPHPHFGIRTKKLKVIPDKLVVTGFSNVEIGGVPTPLVLPFGFYPITKNKKMGLILPRDFDFSDQWGLGLKNVGYYIPLGDRADLTVRTDIYFQGTFGAAVDFRYLQRYKFSGNSTLSFNNRVSEDSKARKVSQKSYGLRWSHNQDAKAHPTRSFGGSVNFETNRNQNRNQNDFNSVYQNTLSSNLSFRKSFPGKPYQFTASMSHSQNTQSRQMTVTLPQANFTMQQIYPLKRKKRVGAERWYEKISLNYSSELRNNIVATDTTIFTRETLNKSRMGIRHQASSSLPLKIFKYITVSPNVSYEENWYPNTIEHRLLDQNTLVYDTTIVQGEQYVTLNEQRSKFGKDTIVRDWGFKTFRSYNAGISINTARFFTKQFKKGWFRGIRHTYKPRVSTGFGPDFTRPRWNYFRDYVTSSNPEFADTLRYGIFDEAIYGRPSFSPRQMVISWDHVNILEMKYFSKRDSTVKRVKIFDGLRFGGTFTPTKDSLKWSTVSTGGVFRLLKGMTNINWNATFDPYIADAKGRQINKFAWKEQGKLVRTVNLGMSVNSNFTMNQLRGFFKKEENSGGENQPKQPSQNAKDDDFLGWFDRFSFNHTIQFDRRLLASGKDTLQITRHGMGVSGSIPLTSKWDLRIGNISYDFQSKSLVYPDLALSRDLHCWEMALSWQPTRGTYNFYINVKPGSLDFLKMPYRKNNQDARFSF